MINHGNTKHTWIFLILFLLTGLIHAVQGRAEGIYFRTIPIESGLSQLSVSTIFQDSKGFLWFGTRDGLNRYDGYSFEIFRNDDSDSTTISNNNIVRIVEDGAGNIWIATESGLNYYNYSSNKFTRFYKSIGNEGISHNKVGSLLYDRKSRLWIGTEQGLDLFDPGKGIFIKTTLDSILFNNRILSLMDDSFGNLWIGTLNTGLIQYNPESKIYHVFQHTDPQESGRLLNTGRTIFEDTDRNLWVGTKNGLFLFEPKNNTFKLFGIDIYKGLKLSNEGIRCIVEDKEKNLLIGTNEGLNILNKETGDLRIYNPSKEKKGNLNHFYIYSMLIDNAGTVWLGTFMGGINYFNKFDQQFQFSSPGNLEQPIYGGVGPLAERGNDLWIGTGGGGLFCFNKQENSYSHFLVEESSFASNVVKSLLISGDTIFVSTEEGKFHLFDIRKQRVINSYQVGNKLIQKIYQESKDKLILCVRDNIGLRLCDAKTGLILPVTYQNSTDRQKMYFPFPTCFEKENDSIYWIGTRYVGLYRYNRLKNTAIRYTFDKNNSNSLSSNHISFIYSDTHNNLWIGTGDGGICVYYKDSNKFKTFGEKEGLLNATVLSILPDNAGFLWISTLSGISRFDPVSNAFKNYTYGNGFPVLEPAENSFLKLADGKLCFGGNNGLATFDPLKIINNKFIPPVVITDFKLLRSDPKKGDLPLHRKFLPDSTYIELKYNQSSFEIQYTALNYIFSEKNRYAYQLEGFDYGWNEVGQQRIAIYTNLHSGNYRFKLKASNNDGIWNEDFVCLNIKVLPPPWLSWYAYIFYLLIFAGLWYSFLRYIRLENKVKLKQMEQENMEKVHQLRIRMFTNFSHELRTPLTLMIGPLEDLLNRHDISHAMRQPLCMIQKNAQRLLLIVNQLMDFRKQESGKMQLKAAEGDFSTYIKEISLAFIELSRKQNINYSFTNNHGEITLWFDRQLLEKVFFNLLSNAFKNTREGGEIEIRVDIATREKLKTADKYCLTKELAPAEEYVEITVSDNGKGISEQEICKIFDPFYQVCDNQQLASTGTGIGLSLSKGIVELHSGTITVESSLGKGTAFKVLLPRGRKHLHDDEIIHDFKDEEHHTHYLIPTDIEEIDDENIAEVIQKTHTVLIVEDNHEVRNYIKMHLKDAFSLLEAINGEDGFSIAVAKMPDLIISDVMMPKMDGLELCRKLKNEVNTSHIPIILLTALTTFRQIKEGFEVGADDYVSKPFNSSLLKMKAISLCDNRERLRKAFSKKFPFEQVHVGASTFDEQFLNKIYAVMDKYLSDSEFDLDAFSGEIGMSRANLYRKIKALTNFAPNELLKNYRLKVAVKLLLEKKYTVSEIAYMVGFGTPAYFSNCFKKTYLLSPSEYLEKQRTRS